MATAALSRLLPMASLRGASTRRGCFARSWPRAARRRLVSTATSLKRRLAYACLQWSGGLISKPDALDDGPAEDRNCQPREPVAESQVKCGVVLVRHGCEEGCEAGGVASCLGHNAASIVGDGEVAVLC